MLSLALTLFVSFSTDAQRDLEAGEAIFQELCVACHTVGGGKLVCTDLIDVHLKYSEDWIIRFVQSPEAMIKAKDPQALKTYEENNRQIMPDAPYDDDQIRDLLAWVRSEYDQLHEGDVDTLEQASKPSTPQTEAEEPAEVAESAPADTLTATAETTEAPEAPEPDLKLGKKNFRICAACHSIGEGKMVGPDLYNEHLEHSEDWLIRFISNPKKMIDAGDPHAVEAYEEYGPTIMPSHAYLGEDGIRAVIAYMKDESDRVTKERAGGGKDPDPGPGDNPPDPEDPDDDKPKDLGSTLTIALLVLCAVLLATISVLSGTIHKLTLLLQDKEK
ncbi:MAG: cytochrome c [Bacteroidota bacterium]